MGRKSALTEKQWEEIERRLSKGEKGRALAREFEISEAAIRKRLGAQTKQIKDVATKLATAEIAFRALPVSAQISARTLADELKDISMHLAGAARYGSATAHRLSALANAEVQKIDDANPLKSSEAIKGVAAMTSLANQSAKIAIDLMAASNKGGAQGEDDADSLESLTDEQLDRLLG
jgi:hypothetical protein